ncbi:hypothetical protein CDL12_26163 [Handroanthus impetiginosus]|uniref:Retrotransposon gag domain-containing protein n=1 Tax=Handroanthus impetiginosus TaxID=429701 RepID=A0A2G9G7Q0_9LAMI|nr:hypothetical protein CDL12_26163 [Handroanthus impetiginosus]
MAEPSSTNFKIVSIPEYSGLTDPSEHLGKFENVALLHQTTLSLFGMKHEEEESLRDFVALFIAAALEVPSATPELLVNAMHKVLRDFDELLSRVKKYINLKDAKKIKRLETTKQKDKGKEECNSSPQERVFSVLFGQKYEQFTLKVSQAKAVCAVQSNNLLGRPRRAASRPFRPHSDKFCKFHNKYGHTTDKCNYLKNELERLIKLGYLRELVVPD